MLIYPFLSCNDRLESKKDLVNSGGTRKLFFKGEGVIRSVYVRRPVAAYIYMCVCVCVCGVFHNC